MLLESIKITWKKILRTNRVSLVLVGFLYLSFLYLMFAEGYPEAGLQNLLSFFPMMAVLLSSGLVRDEFESRQIDPFISRVKAPAMFWGKFLGYSLIIFGALLLGLLLSFLFLAIRGQWWAAPDILRIFLLRLPVALYFIVVGFFLAALLKGVMNFAALFLIYFGTIITVGLLFRAEWLLEAASIIKFRWENVVLLLLLPSEMKQVPWHYVLILTATVGWLVLSFLIFRSAVWKKNLIFASASGCPERLRISGLRKTYREGLAGRHKKEALRGVNFSIKPGKLTGFLGPNGAGKTTTLRIILDFLKPDEGRVEYFSQNPENRRGGRLKAGYLQETASLYPFLTVRETLRYVARSEGWPGEKANELAVELARKLGLEEHLDRRIKSLSKGTVQKVAFGVATIGEPEILIFDEPYTGLDPVIMYEIRKFILELKKKGSTIFLSSHLLPEVEKVCDEVILINRGKIVWAGEIDRLKAVWCLYQASKNNPEVAERMRQHLGEEVQGKPFSYFAGIEPGPLLEDQIVAAAVREIPVPDIEKLFLESVLNS